MNSLIFNQVYRYYLQVIILNVYIYIYIYLFIIMTYELLILPLKNYIKKVILFKLIILYIYNLNYDFINSTIFYDHV